MHVSCDAFRCTVNVGTAMSVKWKRDGGQQQLCSWCKKKAGRHQKAQDPVGSYSVIFSVIGLCRLHGSVSVQAEPLV